MRIAFITSKDGQRRSPIRIKFFAGRGEIEHALMQIAQTASLIDPAEYREREYEDVRAEEVADMYDAIRAATRTSVMNEVRSSFKAHGYGEWSPVDFVPDEVVDAARKRTRELFPEAYDV